ncbi:MAG: sensor histidine kinase [Gorillibacterium sp.]|nr:sensor histidine kinase [Gorillibacterium sp.]
MLTKLLQKLIEPFRRSIRNKLILSMIIISVVPIIAVTGLAAENNRQTIETEVISTSVSNMKWTAVYLGDQFAKLNNIIYSILISPNLKDYLANSDEGSLSTQFAAQRGIRETLTNSFYSAGDQISGLELYLVEPAKLFTINGTQDDIKSVAGVPDLYKPLIEQNQDFIIVTDSENHDQFKLIRSINRFEDRQKLGTIALTIRWSMLDQTLELIKKGEAHQVLIAGSDGKILYQSEGVSASEKTMKRIEQMPDKHGYFQMDGQYVFYDTIDPVGLKLVTIIPTSFINKSAQATLHFGVIIGAISVMASILLAVLLAWRMATPIVSLARSMRGLGLIKESEVPISNRVDEIGLLETKLNNMSSRIKEHIKTEYSMNLDKKTSELKALQAQINPHFLHNTLQMIGSMLFTKKPTECYDIIRSLSEMFRYIIRNPDDLASLKAEMDHLHNYMRIQQQRFATRLHYTTQIDENLLKCPIPKLTLQPLVENAFIHGLESKSGDWIVSVAVFRKKDRVVIEICDNGVGIEVDKLTQLRNMLDGESGPMWTDGNRIGIQNVASRLYMHFGANHGIQINSEQGKGTTVTVQLAMEVGSQADE